jgi:hypothetical protein
LTGLELAVWQLTIFDLFPKQEVNGTVILPPWVFLIEIHENAKTFGKIAWKEGKAIE